jgi:hypothetical protein
MKAIIFGAGSQDCFYLSEILKAKNINVLEISRSSKVIKGNVSDSQFVSQILKSIKPNYIFHLAANSSTKHEYLFENHETICTGTLNILESTKLFCPDAKVYIAGRGMQFLNNGQPIKEKTKSVLKLIRSQNILPTTYLFLTGSFLIDPTLKSKYILPGNPSPNLREMQSIYLYPSICLFEGTVISEGRGTDKPFQIFGHPSLPSNLYRFTPKPNEGAKSSKCFNEVCHGWNLSGSIDNTIKLVNKKIQLNYLLDAYKLFPGKDSFFLKNNFFNKLAGNDILMSQIKKGISENEIRKSWQPKLNKFKAIRKKYLLYPDFKE